MNFLLPLLAAALASSQISALPLAPEFATRELEVRTDCGDPMNTVPLYRVYAAASTNHVYSTDVDAVNIRVLNDGFVLEGVAAQVYETQEGSTVPLFWLNDASTATDNVYTTSTTEKATLISQGLHDVGTVAYIYPSQICDSVPFYRLNKPGVDNFHTTSISERDDAVASGYTFVGITGYVGFQNLFGVITYSLQLHLLVPRVLTESCTSKKY
ncbi:hypothetical protein C8J56DRAFT_1081749 [Mycena floridula]|nr:hypothetical protein C8J56DRAFT_1081749 [Mycena floridula]